jgi:uncharacterized membrane protein YoaK (UPF0700 family)
MRSFERDILLLLLAAAAGSVDAWSYFGLGHAFVANMTGNTVLLGVALSHTFRLDVAPPAIALSSYAFGVILGALFTGALITRRSSVSPKDSSPLWPRRISLVLGLEGALLTAAAVEWSRVYTAPSPLILHLLLSISAVALGLQSAAMLQLRIPGIITTYISGTWTSLVTGLTRLFTGRTPSSSGSISWEERLLMQGAVLAVYLGAAVSSGYLFGHAKGLVGVIPAPCVVAVALYGAFRRDSLELSPKPSTGADRAHR